MTPRPVAALLVTSHSDRPEAETIIGLHALGFRLRVLCSPRAPHFERLRQAGVSVAPLELRKKLDLAAAAAIRAELEVGGYDVLHLFNNKATVNGLIAARGMPVRIVVYRGIVGNESFLNPFSWLRCLNPRVDRIVCVADAVRAYFLDLRLLGLRLAPEKLVTIHKGHDVAWYASPPADRSSLGIPEDALVVGCVANWRPRKGIEVLVDAVDRLPAEAGIHLLLVGHMDDGRLHRRIRSSRHADRIHVLGYRHDAPAVIAACDVAVLPALKREGLPKTVIEAMAYGVPPVVTDVGGSPELVEHEKSGLVVGAGDADALADALLRLAREPVLRLRLGTEARRRIASAFTIERTIAETASLYLELVATRADADLPLKEGAR